MGQRRTVRDGIKNDRRTDGCFFFFTPLNFLPPPYRNCVFTRHLTTLMYTGLSKGENFFLAVERSGVIFVETLPDAEKLGGK